MDFFELKAAMVAKEPVMVRIPQPTYTRVLVGRVVGVRHALDQDDREIMQAEIMPRGTNSVEIVAAAKVERVWEGAPVGG